MVKAITVDAMEVHETAGAAAIAAQANQPVNPMMAFMGVTGGTPAANTGGGLAAEQKC